jgi:hypothetical protein
VNKPALYDQFVFEGDVIASSRMVKILRIVRKEPDIREGELACRIGLRSFLPEWKPLISRLVELKYIKDGITGHGNTHCFRLTEDGEAFLLYKIGDGVEETTPTAEQPTADAASSTPRQ